MGLEAPLEYRVGPEHEIPDGEGVLVVAAGVEIGVFRVHGQLHAYENRCSHQGGPVCTGEIVGRYEQVLNADGTVREERFVDDEPRIACPWHGWEYDLETGQSFLGPGAPPVRTYDVSVEPKGGRRPGPYVAETYPVHVEDAYVVVHTEVANTEPRQHMAEPAEEVRDDEHVAG